MFVNIRKTEVVILSAQGKIFAFSLKLRMSAQNYNVKNLGV